MMTLGVCMNFLTTASLLAVETLGNLGARGNGFRIGNAPGATELLTS